MPRWYRLVQCAKTGTRNTTRGYCVLQTRHTARHQPCSRALRRKHVRITRGTTVPNTQRLFYGTVFKHQNRYGSMRFYTSTSSRDICCLPACTHTCKVINNEIINKLRLSRAGDRDEGQRVCVRARAHNKWLTTTDVVKFSPRMYRPVELYSVIARTRQSII